MDIEATNRMNSADFVAAYGGVFEHSPWVAEQAFAARPFASVAHLHQSMVAAVKTSTRERKLALLRAHPELAGKEAQAGSMTRSSVAEQASAGLDRLSSVEMHRLAELNAGYRAAHGFPFIIAVRHYTKEGIFHEFAQRLSNDSSTELEAALAQVYAIARIRLGKILDEDAVRANEASKAFIDSLPA